MPGMLRLLLTEKFQAEKKSFAFRNISILCVGKLISVILEPAVFPCSACLPAFPGEGSWTA